MQIYMQAFNTSPCPLPDLLPELHNICRTTFIQHSSLFHTSDEFVTNNPNFSHHTNTNTNNPNLSHHTLMAIIRKWLLLSTQIGVMLQLAVISAQWSDVLEMRVYYFVSLILLAVSTDCCSQGIAHKLGISIIHINICTI